MAAEPNDSSELLDPVEELVAVCLQTPPADRPSTVEQLCSDHPDLADELRLRLSLLDEALLTLSEQPAELPQQLGDFRILRRLGGGGMGIVHEARQESLGRTVALKLIRPEHLWFERSRERFRRETEAVARLEHPGIVPVYLVGEEQGLPFFAMERVRGCTLAEALRQLADREPETLTARDLGEAVARAAGEDANGFRGSWIDACLSIARQVAEALHHAHQRGVVHRDVKPSNVMLSPDGRARLIDFGLTIEDGDERVTRTGAVMGTFPYTAPEQLRDARAADARSDVYSLGATLYELLTLRTPFDEERTPAALARIMQGGPDSIRARNRRVAGDVETVCLVAMDVDPVRRYADAAAFARDLAHLEAHRGIEARPPGAVLRFRRLVQRQPVWTTAVALSAAVVVGLPMALYVQASGHAEELGRSLAAAERKRDETDRAARFLTELFHRVSPFERPGPVASVIDMLEVGAQHVDRDLADYPYARGLMQMTLGQLHQDYNLGEGAVDLHRRALASLALSDEPSVDGLVVKTRLSLAGALTPLGGLDEAETILREEIAARAGGSREDLRFALSQLAVVLTMQERSGESCEVFEELLPLLEADPASADSLAFNRITFSHALVVGGRFEQAEEQVRLGLAGLEALYQPPHPRLAQGHVSLAGVLEKLGRDGEAEELYLGAIEMARTLWGEHSEVAAVSHSALAKIYWGRGDHEAAEPQARLGLELTRRATADDSPRAYYARLVLGRILVDLDQFGEALELLEAVVSFERSPGRLGSALHHLGRAQAGLGRAAEAARTFDEALELWENFEGREEEAAATRDARARLGEGR